MKSKRISLVQLFFGTHDTLWFKKWRYYNFPLGFPLATSHFILRKNIKAVNIILWYFTVNNSSSLQLLLGRPPKIAKSKSNHQISQYCNLLCLIWMVTNIGFGIAIILQWFQLSRINSVDSLQLHRSWNWIIDLIILFHHLHTIGFKLNCNDFVYSCPL